MLRRYHQKLFPEGIALVARQLRFYRRLERVWAVIEKDYDNERLSLGMAATQAGISESHLNVLLKRVSGLTFYQLLIRFRLYKAIELMSQRNYTVLEIALSTGFGCQRSLERNFKRLLHTCPVTAKKEVASRLSTDRSG